MDEKTISNRRIDDNALRASKQKAAHKLKNKSGIRLIKEGGGVVLYQRGIIGTKGLAEEKGARLTPDVKVTFRSGEKKSAISFWSA